MANAEHVAQLRNGAVSWNAWRDENPDIDPDLFEADLDGTNLRGTNLSRADLRSANLREADLSSRTHMKWDPKAGPFSRAGVSETDLMEADLSGADLGRADLGGADLRFTNLSRANLRETNLVEADVCGVDLNGADLTRANLRETDFKGARLVGANLTETILYKVDLSGADLSGADLGGANLTDAGLTGANLRGANIKAADLSAATLVEADLTGADLTGCRIYGVSAWGLKLEGTKQQNLVVTRPNEPTVTVDNIEVAQFVYLLLHNEKIRDVIDTVGKKGVLILGRFTADRKAVLDAIREELRKRDYLPILFDFDKPASQDLTATVSTLAHLARFIIADLTDPSSIPYELATVVPTTPVPVQPILLSGSSEFAMFRDLRRRHHWVLSTHRYDGQAQLIADLGEKVIRPAEFKVQDLRSSTEAA
jgi:uncharacterized protein YjbI with pentapeptide repeats